MEAQIKVKLKVECESKVKNRAQSDPILAKQIALMI